MPTIGPNSKMGCQSVCVCVNGRPQGVSQSRMKMTRHKRFHSGSFAIVLELAHWPWIFFQRIPNWALNKWEVDPNGVAEKVSFCIPKTRHGHSITNQIFNHILIFFLFWVCRMQNWQEIECKLDHRWHYLPSSLFATVFFFIWPKRCQSRSNRWSWCGMALWLQGTFAGLESRRLLAKRFAQSLNISTYEGKMHEFLPTK